MEERQRHLQGKRRYCTLRASPSQAGNAAMFEHLVEDFTPPIIPHPLQGFTPLDDADPLALLDAQATTADWLEKMGAASEQTAIEEAQTAQVARDTFAKLTTNQTPEEQKKALLLQRVPAAVRHVVGMLTAYDWEFVEQAKELRGYTVAKILELTEHPDPRHQLRALEMLGKVSEVGLFTERLEITKVDMTDEALEAKIKAKLDRFRHVIDVTDVIETTTTTIPANPKWAEELVNNDPRDKLEPDTP
jgi:hypothetical protein